MSNLVVKSDDWKKSSKPNLALGCSIPIIFPKITEIKVDSDLGCVKAALRSSIKNAKHLLNQIELLDSVAT
ncbi:hypothetical protein BFP78_15345 [Gaetbulibacter sp. 5U11]|uniref:hypothetical protein n=1 Tax=Flavobacterium sp. TaxID=239 RepID=UPI000C14CD94|nr:hypothetical protein BFP78_15345 [Gaetbulibacter sp. 5U11]|tara:strand:+ start:182 stop:394 length:213 start_codon:yes stop_codon:yes gene_type:complete